VSNSNLTIFNKISRLPVLILYICCLPFLAVSQKNLWDENPIFSEKIIDSLEVKLGGSAEKDRIIILNKLAEAYWLVDPDYTIKYASEALQLSRKYDDISSEGFALINLCQGYLFNDLYDKALDYGLRSLEIREKLGNPFDIAFTNRTLGWLFYDIKNFDKALEYHQKVFEIHEEMDDTERCAYSYNSIGLIHLQKKNFLTALSFFKRSLVLKEPFNNQDRIAETLKNIGICYRSINKYDSAIQVLETSLDISRDIKDDYNQTEVLNELAGIYLIQDKFEDSFKALNQARLIMKDLIDNKEYLAKNNLIFSDYYRKMGGYQKALAYYQMYDSLKSQILSEDKSHKLTEMQILYEAERRELEMESLEQQQKSKDQLNKALILAVLLTLTIGALVVGRLRSNLRKNKVIYEKSKLLAQERLKNEELHSAKLQDKLEYRMKELTSLALFIAQRNEVYKGLSEGLKNLDFINREDYQIKIRRFLKEYAGKWNINEDLQKFNANIDHINDEFFYRIREEYPNLTENDLRLCAHLRLSLSSKEISQLNNISVKSVEINRYRLRKKLNLRKNETLTDFLKEF